MILNTGQRTDIPAFYADWFLRRVREGSVMVRNPFNYQRITSYRIDPEVVDVIAFCTKNPAPMLGKLGELAGYRQYWHVTITPYDKDIEPNVPPAGEVISSFRKLSGKVGKKEPSGGTILSSSPKPLHPNATSVHSETWQKNSKAAQNPASFPSSTSTRKPSGTSPKQKESATKSSTAWQKEWQR